MRGEGVTSQCGSPSSGAPPLVQVPVLNVEKPNFSTVFFPRLYPIYSGGAHYSEAKKREKIEFLRR